MLKIVIFLLTVLISAALGGGASSLRELRLPAGDPSFQELPLPAGESSAESDDEEILIEDITESYTESAEILAG